MLKKIPCLIILLLSASLISCTHVKKYSQKISRPSVASVGNLKGLSKVDIAKKFGEPAATSKSGVSENWYYAQPREIWIWFEENKVVRWEAK